MFPGDSRKWAVTRSNEYSDGRVKHYWDGDRITGKAWQTILELKGVAWDVYFLYDEAAHWKTGPTLPDYWMTQLRGVTHAPRLDKDIFEEKTKELLRTSEER